MTTLANENTSVDLSDSVYSDIKSNSDLKELTYISAHKSLTEVRNKISEDSEYLELVSDFERISSEIAQQVALGIVSAVDLFDFVEAVGWLSNLLEATGSCRQFYLQQCNCYLQKTFLV